MKLNIELTAGEAILLREEMNRVMDSNERRDDHMWARSVNNKILSAVKEDVRRRADEVDRKSVEGKFGRSRSLEDHTEEMPG